MKKAKGAKAGWRTRIANERKAEGEKLGYGGSGTGLQLKSGNERGINWKDIKDLGTR